MGLEDWELSRIRINLLLHADPTDLLSRLSTGARSPKFGRASNVNAQRANAAVLASLDAKEELANLRMAIASKGPEERNSLGVDRCDALLAPVLRLIPLQGLWRCMKRTRQTPEKAMHAWVVSA